MFEPELIPIAGSFPELKETDIDLDSAFDLPKWNGEYTLPKAEFKISIAPKIILQKLIIFNKAPIVDKKCFLRKCLFLVNF